MQQVRAALAVIVAAALSLAGSATAATAEEQTATCETGPVMSGPGPADWRQRAVVAGPIAVFKQPLEQMTETGGGQLVAKMPVLTIGHRPVTLSVPPRLRHRVFLYYGFHQGPDGTRTTSIRGFPGYGEIEFHPCTNRPRTPWPGAIRVKGRSPVHLDVIVTGEPAVQLPLGRPRPYEPGD